jgi:hypothetical protein
LEPPLLPPLGGHLVLLSLPATLLWLVEVAVLILAEAAVQVDLGLGHQYL